MVTQERKLVTEIPGPVSRELMGRRQAAVPPGVGTTLPVFVERAEGAVLVDVDGNQLIDMGSGIAVMSVGHAHPDVVAAAQAQLDRFSHTCFMVTPYEGYIAVAEALNRLTPGDHEKRTCLFSAGAEAVENAVKIARRYTGRDSVVVFDHAYHGRTNLTMAMTAKNAPYKDGFGPFASDVYRAPMSYPLRDPDGMTGEEAATRALAVIESQVGADRTACLVIEPIQGEGGFVEPAPGFLPKLAEWCTAHGVVFVADEIQTGFGRTGDMFACEHEGVVPDLITTAKALAGGLPLAAVTGRAEIMDAVTPGGLGGTYGGNPVACASALAAIDVIEREDLAGRARAIGDKVLPGFRHILLENPQIGDVRGRGAMMAVELIVPGTVSTPDPAEAARISNACHAAGVVTLTCGTWGNVLRLLPPLTISDELLQDAMDVISEAMGLVWPE
jgi:4-aminobutyrate aminotransferase/(S)-3-amino-2-methylpropionate transaminase